MSDDEFYIQNLSGNGDTALWWRAESRGYTTVLDQAGVYTRAEAESIERGRAEDVKHSKALVDGLARRVVFRDSLFAATRALTE